MLLTFKRTVPCMCTLVLSKPQLVVPPGYVGKAFMAILSDPGF